jgi:hypothetical protein
MATLTGNSIASTYTGLLSVSGAVGADTVEAVTDGAGTSTSLSLSQQRATITLGSGAGDDFIVDGTTLVVEGDNNRVGIGTASPSDDLEIEGTVRVTRDGTVAQYFKLYSDSGGHNIQGVGTKRLQIGVPSYSNSIVIATSGNVGVGTTSPDANTKLDVVGVIRASGGIQPNGNAYSASEVLDDYEEGTWTASYGGSTDAGTYTKIGRMVYANVLITGASESFTAITGLPFTTSSSYNTGMIGRSLDADTIDSGGSVARLYVFGTSINFKDNGGTGTGADANHTVTTSADTVRLQITTVYEA